MDNQHTYSQQASLTRILKEKELWILVLLGILYFYRPLFLKETFFFRDLFSIFLTHIIDVTPINLKLAAITYQTTWCGVIIVR